MKGLGYALLHGTQNDYYLFPLMIEMFHLSIEHHIFFTKSWCGSLFLLPLQSLVKEKHLFIQMAMEQKESKSNLIADYYSQHYDELMTYVSSHLQHADESEDIVQNIFVRLLQMDKMITPVTLPCLVFTIAKNLIRDYWRHYYYLEEHEHILTKGDFSKLKSEDTESIYAVKEINEFLERGIARLCDKQRKIYRLNVYDGMKVSEIAIKLDVTYKHVEHRLGAARKEMRKYMRRMLA